MKKILVLLALVAVAGYTNAQTCKIKIYYDANGNRIQRVLQCESGRPAGDQVVTRSEQKLINGFGDLNEGAYQVYPNPAENKVNIKLDAAMLTKGCSITMNDLTGKVLFQQNKVSDAVTSISLDGLADGTYFIQIVSGKDRHTVKVVKQN